LGGETKIRNHFSLRDVCVMAAMACREANDGDATRDGDARLQGT